MDKEKPDGPYGNDWDKLSERQKEEEKEGGVKDTNKNRWKTGLPEDQDG